MMKRPIAFAALSATLLGAAISGQRSGERVPATSSVQLLAISDFHGNLEPPSGSNGVIGNTPAGGAEYLATHLKRAVRQNPNSIVVAAGDLIGASPLVSALFHDEPTVESMNAMGLQVSSVGNHEFDQGWRELLRLQKGGCHPTDGCRDGKGFGGARFQYLSANVVRKTASQSAPLGPATAVRSAGGVKIGFIGETLKGTPAIVRPAGTRGLAFLDEASTANAYAAQLKRQGVNAIVLLIHEGGSQAGDVDADPNGCAGFSGDLVPIIHRLSPDIKVVISAHTHRFYNCMIGGHLVTSASSFGRMITHVDLTIDSSSDTIVKMVATNEIVTRDVPKDPDQTKIVAEYGALSAPIANRVIGSVSHDILRRQNNAGESPLGDVIADALLEAARPTTKSRPAVAFMNLGGIRADVVADDRTSGGQRGRVTYGELFNVVPFGDHLIGMTMTGDTIKRLLEQQFSGGGAGRVLQVSNGFTYRYRMSAPRGQHVDPDSIKIDGMVVTPATRIRAVTTEFLVAGNDGFSAFREGVGRRQIGLGLDALVAYFRDRSPVPPGPQNRIVRID